MLLWEIVKRYPAMYVVLRAKERGTDGRVISWEVLNTSIDLDEAIELRQVYQDQSISGVCIYPAMETEDEAHASIIAQFFRVLYGME